MGNLFNKIADSFSREVARKGAKLEIAQTYKQAISTYELGCDDDGNIEDEEIVGEAFGLAAEVTRMEMVYRQKYKR